MKTLNFEVRDGALERLNYYRKTNEGGSASQADFVRQAIAEKCDRVALERTGGTVLAFQNPDLLAKSIPQKDRFEILAILKEADLKVSRLAPGAVDLAELISFCSTRLLKTRGSREEFERNMTQDLHKDEEYLLMKHNELLEDIKKPKA